MSYTAITRKVISSNLLVKLFISLNIKSFYNLLFLARIYVGAYAISARSQYIAFLYEIIKQNEIDAREQRFFFVTDYILLVFFFHRYSGQSKLNDGLLAKYSRGYSVAARAKDIQ